MDLEILLKVRISMGNSILWHLFAFPNCLCCLMQPILNYEVYLRFHAFQHWLGITSLDQLCQEPVILFSLPCLAVGIHS